MDPQPKNINVIDRVTTGHYPYTANLYILVGDSLRPGESHPKGFITALSRRLVEAIGEDDHFLQAEALQRKLHEGANVVDLEEAFTQKRSVLSRELPDQTILFTLGVNSPADNLKFDFELPPTQNEEELSHLVALVGMTASRNNGNLGTPFVVDPEVLNGHLDTNRTLNTVWLNTPALNEWSRMRTARMQYGTRPHIIRELALLQPIVPLEHKSSIPDIYTQNPNGVYPTVRLNGVSIGLQYLSQDSRSIVIAS